MTKRIGAHTAAMAATFLLGQIFAGPASAEETEATIGAYAAGYKAAFTCSATFNAGKTPDQIAAHELTGIYPLVADIVADLPAAEIDHEAKRVSVHYSQSMPPRISQWRPHLGCVQLPVGATEEAAELMPRIDLPVPDATVDDGGPWTRHVPVNGSTGNNKLDAVIDAVFNDTTYGRDAVTSAILIATPDAILAERYIDGYSPTTSQRTWSVAKSVAASVIGAAVHQDLLDVKAPALVPEWQKPADPRKSITLENLLHMSSGLDSNRAGNRTDRLYLGGGLVTDTATEGALEAVPGKRWKYANNDTLLAVRSLRAKLGKEAYLRFPFEEVLYKIGMTHTKPETDWDGNFIFSSQVWTTSRDLARLGVLYLNDGVWNGERILPENWRDYVASPAPAQPPETYGSGRAVPGYGAQWWLYNERFPELPNDAFAARGNRGQFLMVIPSEDLLVVRRGYDPAGGQGFQLHSFTEDVLAALGR